MTATVLLSFDNLGEVADLARGRWPEDAPLGSHFSVTRALPRVLEVLADAGERATFFVEGRNADLYPQTLRDLAAAGHEVGYHGWCHETWSGLDPPRERELLARGRRAMAGLGIDLRGFRPPGGRLTDATLPLLRELGYTHCSPAGTGSAVRDGIAVLPFRWELVDAYYRLPRFAGLRGTTEPLPGTELAAALRAALDGGAQVSALFHPFLLDDPDDLDVLRDFLAAVRRAGARCVPHAEAHVAGDDLQLDLTPA